MGEGAGLEGRVGRVERMGLFITNYDEGITCFNNNSRDEMSVLNAIRGNGREIHGSMIEPLRI